jgi:hypothetical protein
MEGLKKLVSWILKGWFTSSRLSHIFPIFLSSGWKLRFKHGIPMSQEMTSFLTKLLCSLMGSPEIDVPHIPAAGLCCHLEELLLYQNSHWSLLFQGNNFVIKKWFVILRLGKQAYEGGRSSFGEMAITLRKVCFYLTLFCFTERARTWHKLKFCKANLSGSASFCSLPLKINCLVFYTPTRDIPSVA